MSLYYSYVFFFFNDTATTEIYTLSLHDALPISAPTSTSSAPSRRPRTRSPMKPGSTACSGRSSNAAFRPSRRSEEHTSELQSRLHLVCRLLLEKKKKEKKQQMHGRYRRTREFVN